MVTYLYDGKFIMKYISKDFPDISLLKIDKIKRICMKIDELEGKKYQAIKEQDFERAIIFRDKSSKLKKALLKACPNIRALKEQTKKRKGKEKRYWQLVVEV